MVFDTIIRYFISTIIDIGIRYFFGSVLILNIGYFWRPVLILNIQNFLTLLSDSLLKTVLKHGITVRSRSPSDFFRRVPAL